MSSRLAVGREAARAQPVAWPSLDEGPEAASPPPPELEEALQSAESELVRLDAERVRLEQELNAQYQRGVVDGRRAAEQELRAQHDSSIEKLSRELASLAALRDRLRREAESDLVRLASIIASRVLRRQLHTEPGLLNYVAAAAIEQLRGADLLKIRVAPKQAEAVRDHLKRLGAGAAAQVEADPNLADGGLIVETSRGGLDASLETQLKEIDNALSLRLGY
jgi:flagellar biosynthesis/type III secretory pathway protein FliH